MFLNINNFGSTKQSFNITRASYWIWTWTSSILLPTWTFKWLLSKKLPSLHSVCISFIPHQSYIQLYETVAISLIYILYEVLQCRKITWMVKREHTRRNVDCISHLESWIIPLKILNCERTQNIILLQPKGIFWLWKN